MIYPLELEPQRLNFRVLIWFFSSWNPPGTRLLEAQVLYQPLEFRVLCSENYVVYLPGNRALETRFHKRENSLLFLSRDITQSVIGFTLTQSTKTLSIPHLHSSSNSQFLSIPCPSPNSSSINLPSVLPPKSNPNPQTCLNTPTTLPH